MVVRDRIPVRFGPFALATMVCCLLFAQTGLAKIQIPKGKEVVVTFAPGIDVTSKMFKKGDPIPIVLDQPIDIGGKILVKSGTPGKAVVVGAEKAGKRGKPGMIQVVFEELKPDGPFQLTEGDFIKLEADTLTAEGKGKKTLSWILGFGFFIKGGEARIDAGRTFTVKVAESVFMDEQGQ